MNKTMQAILQALSYGGIEVESARWIADLKKLDPMRIFVKKLDIEIYNEEYKVPVRLYFADEASMESGNENVPVILFFHGGGWTTESVETYDRVCSRMAQSIGQLVVSVEYRLAPEHRFPVGFEDCYAAAKALFAGEILPGIRPEQITVMGDSAGGNLAAAVCMKARDTGDFRPQRQILIYPALSNCYTEDSPYESVRTNGTGYLLTSEKMADYLGLYESKPEDRENPYFAPLCAEDYTALPDTLILTAEFDPLRDEGEEYGRRMRQAGCRVRIERIEGALHGYFALGIQHLYVQESFRHINRFLSVERALNEQRLEIGKERGTGRVKEKRQRRWRKLDNAAQAFPAAAGKKDSRVFRFYCVLKETVDADTLQRALDLTMEKYPLFRSVLRKGLFWFYMEPRKLPALVREEDRPPCSRIYVPDQKRLLFEVTYYKNRINLEVFHGLTDGTGAMQFLKELVRNYLTLTYPGHEFPEADGGETLTDSDYEEDSFSQYYTGKKSRSKKSRKAFQLRGERLEQAEMQITELILSASEVHKKAKEYGVSVTAYLAAAFLYAIYEEVPKSGLKRPLSLMIPVNLRNFFPSGSMTNFWSWIETALDFGENTKLEDVIGKMKEMFGKDSVEKEISGRMNDLVRLEKNPFLRAVPLEIKNLFLLAGTTLGGRSVTAVYSNMGRIQMADTYEDYIERFGFFASTDKMQMCSCSYGDTMVLGLTSKIIDPNICRNFVSILKRDGIECHIQENDFPGYQEKPSRRALMGLKIFSFTCTAAVVICWMLNYLLTFGRWWAGYVTAGVFCTWLLIMVGYRKRKNPLKNGMWQLVIVTAGSLLWDVFTGWQGWSVDFVIPLAILVNMLSMVIISAAGKMEVAEYLFYLVQAGACGLIPFILLIAGAVSVPYPSVICSGVSLLFLLGLVLFKWKDFVREVQKKFRV